MRKKIAINVNLEEIIEEVFENSLNEYPDLNINVIYIFRSKRNIIFFQKLILNEK